MRQVQPGKILRIHISESDRHQGKPLYEAIVAKCRELKIAGATAFLGEGYGGNGRDAQGTSGPQRPPDRNHDRRHGGKYRAARSRRCGNDGHRLNSVIGSPDDPRGEDTIVAFRQVRNDRVGPRMRPLAAWCISGAKRFRAGASARCSQCRSHLPRYASFRPVDLEGTEENLRAPCYQRRSFAVGAGGMRLIPAAISTKASGNR
jgi:hypothetical protein